MAKGNSININDVLSVTSNPVGNVGDSVALKVSGAAICPVEYPRRNMALAVARFVCPEMLLVVRERRDTNADVKTGKRRIAANRAFKASAGSFHSMAEAMMTITIATV